MTYSIPREVGIKICEQCPHADCIGDQFCKPMIVAAKRYYRTKMDAWRDEALNAIETALSERPFLLAREAADIAEISARQIHSFKAQGRLVCEKVGGGRDSLRIIGVIHK